MNISHIISLLIIETIALWGMYVLGRSSNIDQVKRLPYRQQCKYILHEPSIDYICSFREHGCVSMFCRKHCKEFDCNCGIYEEKQPQITAEQQAILAEIKEIC